MATVDSNQCNNYNRNYNRNYHRCYNHNYNLNYNRNCNRNSSHNSSRNRNRNYTRNRNRRSFAAALNATNGSRPAAHFAQQAWLVLLSAEGTSGSSGGSGGSGGEYAGSLKISAGRLADATTLMRAVGAKLHAKRHY